MQIIARLFLAVLLAISFGCGDTSQTSDDPTDAPIVVPGPGSIPGAGARLRVVVQELGGSPVYAATLTTVPGTQTKTTNRQGQAVFERVAAGYTQVWATKVGCSENWSDLIVEGSGEQSVQIGLPCRAGAADDPGVPPPTPDPGQDSLIGNWIGSVPQGSITLSFELDGGFTATFPAEHTCEGVRAGTFAASSTTLDITLTEGNCLGTTGACSYTADGNALSISACPVNGLGFVGGWQRF